LATRLDRYLAGNDRALAVVREPTETEEQKRAHKRQRQQLSGLLTATPSEKRSFEKCFWKTCGSRIRPAARPL
jgi:hypothetical protein